MLCGFKIGQNVWDLCKCPMAGRKTSIFAAFPTLFCIASNEKMFVIGQVLHITVIMDLNCKTFAHTFHLKQHQTCLIVKNKKYLFKTFACTAERTRITMQVEACVCVFENITGTLLWTPALSIVYTPTQTQVTEWTCSSAVCLFTSPAGESVVMKGNITQKRHHCGKWHQLLIVTDDSRSKQTIKCE